MSNSEAPGQPIQPTRRAARRGAKPPSAAAIWYPRACGHGPTERHTSGCVGQGSSVGCARGADVIRPILLFM